MKYIMDDVVVYILGKVGIFFNELGEIIEILIPREVFLDLEIYCEIKDKLNYLKQNFSSTYLTSLHKDAFKKQQFPLLNLVRQILLVYHYNMVPIRKCDGYTLEGVKKFKRYFFIKKI
jgi:hypothetical protein